MTQSADPCALIAIRSIRLRTSRIIRCVFPPALRVIGCVRLRASRVMRCVHPLALRVTLSADPRALHAIRNIRLRTSRVIRCVFPPALRVIQSAQPSLPDTILNEREGSPVGLGGCRQGRPSLRRRSFALIGRAFGPRRLGALDDTQRARGQALSLARKARGGRRSGWHATREGAGALVDTRRGRAGALDGTQREGGRRSG